MTPRNTSVSYVYYLALVVVLSAGALLPAWGQGPLDQSHSRVIFSKPGTQQEAAAKGQGENEKWLRIATDPRYVQQLRIRGPWGGVPRGASTVPAQDNLTNSESASTGEDSGISAADTQDLRMDRNDLWRRRQRRRSTPKGDWSYFLGNTAAGVSAGTAPAKFSFDIYGTPSCTNDYAVFALNQSGGTNQPSLVAYNGLYSGPAVSASALGYVTANNVSSGSTVKVNNVTVSASPPTAAGSFVQINCTTQACTNPYTLTIDTTTYSIRTTLSGSSPANQVLDCGSGTTGHTQTAENLKAAMDDNSGECGCTSSSACFRNVSSAHPTVTATSAGSQQTQMAAKTPGTGGNSIALSDTGCVSPCSGAGVTEISLNTTSTTSTRTSTTFGATGTAGTDGTTTAGSTFAYWSGSSAISASALATNLATAIGGVTGVDATASGQAINVTASTTGTTGNSITLGVPNFTGFTWSSGTLLGGSLAGSGAPCTGSAPALLFTYNVTSSAVTTSPTISADTTGSKIAFVEKASTSTGFATLHMIKWASGEGTSLTGSTYHPVAPAATTTNWNTSCSGSCMINLGYTSSGATSTNSNSSPFIDYGHDTMYVGSDNGYLYKISPVFNGGSTPPAVSWSFSTGGTVLTSPTYDSVTQHVFVADSSGHLYCVTSAGAACGTTISGLTNPDDPIVDSSTGKVFVFAAQDSMNGSAATVLQANVADLSGVVRASIGTGSASTLVFDGAFDNNYYNSTTGYLYACGNPGGTPTLYRVPLTTGTMSATAVAGPAIGSGAGGCSPLTEVENYASTPGTDWLFLGNTANCGFGGSSTGCVASWNISQWLASQAYTVGTVILDSNWNIQGVTTAGTSKSGTAPVWNASQNGTTTDNGVTWTNLGQLIPTATFAEAGGTSAVVVDNVSTNPHNSSMYFTNLTTGRTCGTAGGSNASACAVNVTQAGLH